MSPHAAGHVGVVTLAPTLAKMAEMYELSREGGASSPRFQAYVSRAAGELGLVAYNPMAGTAAQETVQQLIALDAETLALATAQRVAQLVQYPDDFTIAVAVRSTGLWTHRVATEVDERAAGKPRTAAFGIVSLWSREPNNVDDVLRETAAECVRVIWTTEHGNADTLRTLLAREGLAYAIASEFAALGPYAGGPRDEDTLAVMGALDVLGDSGDSSDMVGVLFGDGAATALGWTTLDVPDYAGYRWAIERARQHVKASGAARALRAGVQP